MTGFLALADLVTVRQACRKSSRILFDWSELISWNFTRPPTADIKRWLACAEGTDRVAIVHQRRWNRQAAWFAALLRTKNCQVRSFSVDDRDRAVIWLNDRLL